MSSNNAKNRKEVFVSNLLSSPRARIHRSFPFLSPRDAWKVLSGNWIFSENENILHLKEPNVKFGESIAVIGSTHLANCKLGVTFKILTNSIKPPEGGVIVFFKFKNIKNYYSFHFCVSKKKIELIKRVEGSWYTIGQRDYGIDVDKEYSFSIKTNEGLHQLDVDHHALIKNRDVDILRGAIGIGAKYCDVEFTHLQIST